MESQLKSSAVFIAWLFFCWPVFGQGGLTPPGPPAPVMKTLDQVEPRRPVPGGSAFFVINEEGSYFLTTNRYGKLLITADNVSLDLCGFMVRVPGQRGIEIAPGVNNVRVGNGIIAECDTGIYAPDVERGGNLFENLTVTGNGVGILAGPGCLVECCRVTDNLQTGVRIERGAGNAVRRCEVSNNDEHGIHILSGCGCIEDNRVENNGIAGLKVADAGSVVRNNLVRGNADNYDFVAGSQLELLLSEVPETLDWPCSARFTGTLICDTPNTNGITVTSRDVTVDMAGHALERQGEQGAGSGVFIAGAALRTVVRNGRITGWLDSAAAGIRGAGAEMRLAEIHSHKNYVGFDVGDSAHIEACVASHSIDSGFKIGANGCVNGSLASRNQNIGYEIAAGCIARNCLAVRNGHDGIMAERGCLIDRCNVQSNSFDGIFATDCCRVTGCLVDGNGEDGIEISSQCTVSECTLGGNGRTGINVMGSMNAVERNTVTASGVNPVYPPAGCAGILVGGINNLIVRNMLSANGSVDFNVGPGNQIGTVIPPPVPAAPGVVGNAGGGFGAVDPFANVVY